jgi:hypothetical protein
MLPSHPMRRPLLFSLVALISTISSCGVDERVVSVLASPEASVDGDGVGNVADTDRPDQTTRDVTIADADSFEALDGTGDVHEAEESEAGATPDDAGADSAADAETPMPLTDELILWFRADVGITEKDGIVSKWADQSPNHNDAWQVNLTNQPRLVAAEAGRPSAVVFDADKFLSLPPGFADFSSGLTMFAVSRSRTCPYAAAASCNSRTDRRSTTSRSADTRAKSSTKC